jgi:hypothetical protein
MPMVLEKEIPVEQMDAVSADWETYIKLKEAEAEARSTSLRFSKDEVISELRSYIHAAYNV